MAGKKELEVSPGLTRSQFIKKWGFDPLMDRKHPGGPTFDVNSMKIQAKLEEEKKKKKKKKRKPIA